METMNTAPAAPAAAPAATFVCRNCGCTKINVSGDLPACAGCGDERVPAAAVRAAFLAAEAA